jgi:glycosyltransferase involved in cell wall biosynthesis
MRSVAHLTDDLNLGGVTRALDVVVRGLGPGFDQRIVQVAPKRMTPVRVASDVLVVHVSASWAKLPYLAALRLSNPRARLIIVEHTYTASFARLHVVAPARFATMLRCAYGLADAVVAVSRIQADWISASRFVPDDRLHVIRSASDLDALLDVPVPVRAPGPLRVGAYGRYSHEKGFDLLIEAFRRIPPELATLSLRGLGPERARLEALAADLPHVTIGDVLNDIPRFLAEIDVIAVPSRRESFGSVALEARAGARPLVATAVDGLIEQLDPAYGRSVRPEDPEAMAAAIRTLAAADLPAMGAAARRSAINHVPEVLAAWKRLLTAPVLAPVARLSQTSPT